MEHYEQTELYIQSPLFTTNTIMARLSDLLSELDVVDKLAEGQVNKLVANISEWSSSKQADSVFYHPGWDWTWSSNLYFDKYVLTKFLSFNKRFTKAMDALTSYHSTIDGSRMVEKCVESWSQRFQVFRRTRRDFHQLLKVIKRRRELDDAGETETMGHNC